MKPSSLRQILAKMSGALLALFTIFVATATRKVTYAAPGINLKGSEPTWEISRASFASCDNASGGSAPEVTSPECGLLSRREDYNFQRDLVFVRRCLANFASRCPNGNFTVEVVGLEIKNTCPSAPGLVVFNFGLNDELKDLSTLADSANFLQAEDAQVKLGTFVALDLKTEGCASRLLGDTDGVDARLVDTSSIGGTDLCKSVNGAFADGPSASKVKTTRLNTPPTATRNDTPTHIVNPAYRTHSIRGQGKAYNFLALKSLGGSCALTDPPAALSAFSLSFVWKVKSDVAAQPQPTYPPIPRSRQEDETINLGEGNSIDAFAFKDCGPPALTLAVNQSCRKLRKEKPSEQETEDSRRKAALTCFVNHARDCSAGKFVYELKLKQEKSLCPQRRAGLRDDQLKQRALFPIKMAPSLIASHKSDGLPNLKHEYFIQSVVQSEPSEYLNNFDNEAKWEGAILGGHKFEFAWDSVEHKVGKDSFSASNVDSPEGPCGDAFEIPADTQRIFERGALVAGALASPITHQKINVTLPLKDMQLFNSQGHQSAILLLSNDKNELLMQHEFQVTLTMLVEIHLEGELPLPPTTTPSPIGRFSAPSRPEPTLEFKSARFEKCGSHVNLTPREFPCEREPRNAKYFQKKDIRKCFQKYRRKCGHGEFSFGTVVREIPNLCLEPQSQSLAYFVRPSLLTPATRPFASETRDADADGEDLDLDKMEMNVTLRDMRFYKRNSTDPTKTVSFKPLTHCANKALPLARSRAHVALSLPFAVTQSENELVDPFDNGGADDPTICRQQPSDVNTPFASPARTGGYFYPDYRNPRFTFPGFTSSSNGGDQSRSIANVLHLYGWGKCPLTKELSTQYFGQMRLHSSLAVPSRALKAIVEVSVQVSGAAFNRCPELDSLTEEVACTGTDKESLSNCFEKYFDLCSEGVFRYRLRLSNLSNQCRDSHNSLAYYIAEDVLTNNVLELPKPNAISKDAAGHAYGSLASRHTDIFLEEFSVPGTWYAECADRTQSLGSALKVSEAGNGSETSEVVCSPKKQPMTLRTSGGGSVGGSVGGGTALQGVLPNDRHQFLFKPESAPSAYYFKNQTSGDMNDYLVVHGGKCNLLDAQEDTASANFQVHVSLPKATPRPTQPPSDPAFTYLGARFENCGGRELGAEGYCAGKKSTDSRGGSSSSAGDVPLSKEDVQKCFQEKVKRCAKGRFSFTLAAQSVPNFCPTTKNALGYFISDDNLSRNKPSLDAEYLQATPKSASGPTTDYPLSFVNIAVNGSSVGSLAGLAAFDEAKGTFGAYARRLLSTELTTGRSSATAICVGGSDHPTATTTRLKRQRPDVFVPDAVPPTTAEYRPLPPAPAPVNYFFFPGNRNLPLRKMQDELATVTFEAALHIKDFVPPVRAAPADRVLYFEIANARFENCTNLSDADSRCDLPTPVPAETASEAELADSYALQKGALENCFKTRHDLCVMAGEQNESLLEQSKVQTPAKFVFDLRVFNLTNKCSDESNSLGYELPQTDMNKALPTLSSAVHGNLKNRRQILLKRFGPLQLDWLADCAASDKGSGLSAWTATAALAEPTGDQASLERDRVWSELCRSGPQQQVPTVPVADVRAARHPMGGAPVTGETQRLRSQRDDKKNALMFSGDGSCPLVKAMTAPAAAELEVSLQLSAVKSQAPPEPGAPIWTYSDARFDLCPLEKSRSSSSSGGGVQETEFHKPPPCTEEGGLSPDSIQECFDRHKRECLGGHFQFKLTISRISNYCHSGNNRLLYYFSPEELRQRTPEFSLPGPITAGGGGGTRAQPVYRTDSFYPEDKGWNKDCADEPLRGQVQGWIDTGGLEDRVGDLEDHLCALPRAAVDAPSRLSPNELQRLDFSATPDQGVLQKVRKTNSVKSGSGEGGGSGEKDLKTAFVIDGSPNCRVRDAQAGTAIVELTVIVAIPRAGPPFEPLAGDAAPVTYTLQTPRFEGCPSETVLDTFLVETRNGDETSHRTSYECEGDGGVANDERRRNFEKCFKDNYLDCIGGTFTYGVTASSLANKCVYEQNSLLYPLIGEDLRKATLDVYDAFPTTLALNVISFQPDLSDWYSEECSDKEKPPRAFVSSYRSEYNTIDNDANLCTLSEPPAGEGAEKTAQLTQEEEASGGKTKNVFRFPIDTALPIDNVQSKQPEPESAAVVVSGQQGCSIRQGQRGTASVELMAQVQIPEDPPLGTGGVWPGLSKPGPSVDTTAPGAQVFVYSNARFEFCPSKAIADLTTSGGSRVETIRCPSKNEATKEEAGTSRSDATLTKAELQACFRNSWKKCPEGKFVYDFAIIRVPNACRDDQGKANGPLAYFVDHTVVRGQQPLLLAPGSVSFGTDESLPAIPERAAIHVVRLAPENGEWLKRCSSSRFYPYLHTTFVPRGSFSSYSSKPESLSNRRMKRDTVDFYGDGYGYDYAGDVGGDGGGGDGAADGEEDEDEEDYYGEKVVEGVWHDVETVPEGAPPPSALIAMCGRRLEGGAYKKYLLPKTKTFDFQPTELPLLRLGEPGQGTNAFLIYGQRGCNIRPETNTPGANTARVELHVEVPVPKVPTPAPTIAATPAPTLPPATSTLRPSELQNDQGEDREPAPVYQIEDAEKIALALERNANYGSAQALLQAAGTVSILLLLTSIF